MSTTLRDKLIQKGWVTNFNADTLVRLIEEHYAGLAEPQPPAEGEATPQPIPVTERLPEAGDCDAEGRCWIHMPDIGTAPSWRLVEPREIGPYHTHWLPAHALPLPTNQPTRNQ